MNASPSGSFFELKAHKTIFESEMLYSHRESYRQIDLMVRAITIRLQQQGCATLSTRLGFDNRRTYRLDHREPKLKVDETQWMIVTGLLQAQHLVVRSIWSENKTIIVPDPCVEIQSNESRTSHKNLPVECIDERFE